MFMLTQRQVVLEQALQPLTHADLLARTRQTHAQRDAVDEQAHGVLHFGAVDRSPRHGHAEQHFIQPAVALQHQCPGSLGQGVDGQLITLRQLTQGTPLTGLEVGIHVADLREAALTAQSPIERQRCGLFEPGQFLRPCFKGFALALLLQPLNKIAVSRRRRQAALAAVEREEILQQQRTAPGVNQDVVVAEDEPVMTGAAANQTQVEGRRVEQVESFGAVLGQQRLQRGFVLGFGAPGPVVDLNLGRGIAVNDLQHLPVIVQAEGGAQGIVTLGHGVPGRRKARQVDFTVNDVAVLHEVDARTRLKQGVHQQTLLHRRQRVDVFNGAGRHFEAVQLLLGETRQREVGGGHAARFVGHAMLDQRTQLLLVVLNQRFKGVRVEHLAAVGPLQVQLAAVHLPLDAQPVGQRCVLVLSLARAFGSRDKQGLFIKLAVELPQVVERDARGRQRRQLRPRLLACQITQQAVTDAFVRHAAQLLLDGFDRLAQPGRGGELHREQAGEPAHRARQVHVSKQLFAAMTFELNQAAGVTAPAADHPCQCRQ